jgi:hypothetical protein
MTVHTMRTLLDVVIAGRRWTAEECVQHFAAAARSLGEPATLSAAQLKRWRRGRVKDLPRPTACRVAEHLFGHPIEALLAPAPVDHDPARPPAGDVIRPPTSQPPTPRWALRLDGPERPADPYQLDGEFDPIMSAAHDASEHAADAGHAIDDTTLEQLHAEVIRLAHGYAATSPMVMFGQLKRARDLTYRMLERTKRPNQLADLYLIAGQLSGLMAGASFDLGQSDAASEQARAALTYGQVIDHATLRAWARATLAMISLWSGRPADGVTHARAGLEHVTAGDVAVRLNSLAGRCWALAGSRESAIAAVRAADDARHHDAGTDPFAGGIGGEFAFGAARHSLSLGATHLALGDPVSAADHTQSALELYNSGPGEQRAVGGIHGARVDLATARAMGQDLDGVLDAVTPTLDLEPEHRTLRLASRLFRLRGQLNTSLYQGSVQAARLSEAIEGFLATASTSPLALP